MSPATRSSRPQFVASLLAGSLAVSLSACAADSEGQALSPPTTLAAASPTTASPSTTAVPSTTEVADTVETTAPSITEAPAPTVPAEPLPVREMMTLTAGWPYISRNFSVPFSFVMPSDDQLGRWRMLFDTGNYLILTLNMNDRPEPEVLREEPGVVFYALPVGITTDQFIALWTAYAAEQESFTVDASEGAYLGSPSAVVSGSYELGDRHRGALFLRLDDVMSVPVAPGERMYLSYFVPVGDRTVMVHINAHALDFDQNVTLVNQVVDSVEFQ